MKGHAPFADTPRRRAFRKAQAAAAARERRLGHRLEDALREAALRARRTA